MDGNLIKILVQGADEDCLPEALDGLRGLSVSFEPVEERLPSILRNGRSKRHHGAADSHLVAKTQTVHPEKCQSSMQGSGERRRRNHGSASSRLEERQLLIPANFVLNSRATIKIEQVGTAAEQHVLAIVDNFTGAGMLIRRGATAEIRAALKQRHAKTGFGQGASRGEAGQPASGYGHCRRMCRMRMGRISLDRGRHHTRRFRIPFPRTVSFSRTVNRTRSPKTSY